MCLRLLQFSVYSFRETSSLCCLIVANAQDSQLPNGQNFTIYIESRSWKIVMTKGAYFKDSTLYILMDQNKNIYFNTLGI